MHSNEASPALNYWQVSNYLTIRYLQHMLQMAFCDLSHIYHKQVTNVSPAYFCHHTVGIFDVSPDCIRLSVITCGEGGGGGDCTKGGDFTPFHPRMCGLKLEKWVRFGPGGRGQSPAIWVYFRGVTPV